MTRYMCPFCHEGVALTAKFCPNCGKEIIGRLADPYEHLAIIKPSNPMDTIGLINSKIDYLEQEIKDLDSKLEKIMKHLDIEL